MVDLWIVFDGAPGPEAGRFVEVEDGSGASVGPAKTGADWVHSKDGYWRLGPFRSSVQPEEVPTREEPDGGS